MLLLRPQHISEQHWESIQLHAARVANQIAGDAGGLIGACKELVECVAKVVLVEATSPELEEFPKLIKKACTLLAGATPATDGDEQASTLAKGLAILVGSYETAAQGLSELRNEHGSGHGQPLLPNIAAEDTELVRAYAHAWCTWALARLDRLLTNSVSVLIEELTGTTFRAGLLRRRMREVGFETLGFEEQERLGFAVAERGARRETFVVAIDGLDPLEQGSTWPIAYQYGVAKGLLLTADGRLLPTRARTLAAVLPRLSVELQTRLLEDAEWAGVPSDVRRDEERMLQIWSEVSGLTPCIDESLRSIWDADIVRPFFVPF